MGRYTYPHAGWMTVPPGPGLATDTQFYALAFPVADNAALQNFLDESYNVAAGRKRFKILIDRVFLFAVLTGKMAAGGDPHIGTITENDIGFWLLVGEYAEGDPFPSSIAWVPAYLFIDNAFAMTIGREIWGFPKFHATMELPAEKKSAGPFKISAQATRTYSQDAHASLQHMFTFTGANIGVEPGQGGAGEIFRKLCGWVEGEILDWLTHPDWLSHYLGSVGVPFTVFYLKQFRAADGDPQACYQTLLKGPLVLTAVRDFAFLTGTWTLDMDAYDSMPFITTLGLGTPVDGKLTLQAGLALWADIDFTCGLASPLA